jgi:alpha-amylase
MVDRFLPTTPSDEDPSNYLGGTLSNLIQHLDYFKNLGITTLLLNPVTDSDAYHGYSVLDLFSVNPHFGTIEDYQRLIAEAHKRNIRVLFDLVLNHTSGNADLKKAHPDWYRIPRKLRAVNEALIPEYWTSAQFFLLHDLRQEDEQVFQFLLKAAKFWINQGIDGFRMDAVSLIAPQFWERFNGEVRGYAPRHFLILGEIFFTDYEAINPYLSSFQAFFNFKEQQEILNVLRNGVSAAFLKYHFAQDRLLIKPDVLHFTFLDNHDLPRFVSEMPRKHKLDSLKLALTFLFITRGVPVLLYGTERALDNEPRLKGTLFDRGRSRFEAREYPIIS